MRELGRPELARPLGRRPVRIERAVRALVGNLDTIATEAACPVWVEKTPTHYAYIDQIEPSRFNRRTD